VILAARQDSLRDTARRRHGTSAGAMMIVGAGLSVDTGCPPILGLTQRNGGTCGTNVALMFRA
jgi:hypothetical protein